MKIFQHYLILSSVCGFTNLYSHQFLLLLLLWISIIFVCVCVFLFVFEFHFNRMFAFMLFWVSMQDVKGHLTNQKFFIIDFTEGLPIQLYMTIFLLLFLIPHLRPHHSLQCIFVYFLLLLLLLVIKLAQSHTNTINIVYWKRRDIMSLIDYLMQWTTCLVIVRWRPPFLFCYSVNFSIQLIFHLNTGVK